MQEQGLLKINYVVLCDNVRREDNGKNILIGVYASDVQVTRFPARLNLAMYMSIDVEKAGKVKFDLRVLDAEKPIFEGNATALIDRIVKNGALAYPVIPLELPAATTLVFQIKFDEGSWQTLRELPVKLKAS